MKTSASWPKHIYLIAGADAAHQHKASPQSMGFKAYNLRRMADIGLPVPPALVIGTQYAQSPEDCLMPVFGVGLSALQEATGKVYGDPRNPLLVSVRSGAPVSMPGMLETLLNIGLCDATLPGLLRQTGNPRLVWDAYRRLISSHAEIVAQLPAELFEAELARATQGRDERLLDFSELRDLTRRFQTLYLQAASAPFPQDVNEQLTGAIRAVFASWESDKARTYRKLNHIDAAMGTAVTIQSMVFGNSGGHSGAGVGFTRDPTTGDKRLWVDFLANAQGEDVVSGRRSANGHEALAELNPQAWRQLEASAQLLEREFTDMQDFEFTVQDGQLHMLQTRSGKRTPLAAARIALDLLDEGVIDADTARQRTKELHKDDIATLRLAPVDGTGAPAQPLASAIPACPGVATGEIVLDAERALLRSEQGTATILVRQDAQTSDLAALESARGLLTQRGARTSHAAVVARQLGRVCVVGCAELRIDTQARTVSVGDSVLKEGQIITLDGNEGAIYRGELASVLVADEALLHRLQRLRSTGHHGHHDSGAPSAPGKSS